MLLKMMKSARLRLPDESPPVPYVYLSPDRLEVVRGEVAVQLDRAYSAAIAATLRSGISSSSAQLLWRCFKEELQQLTTLTMLITGQLKK